MVTYRMGGKGAPERRLEVSDNMIAIPTPPPGEAGKVLPRTMQVLRNMRRDTHFSHQRIDVLDASLLGDRAQEARLAFKEEPAFEFAGRVLVDPNSREPVVYSERVFLKLEDDASPRHVEKLLSKRGPRWRVVRRPAYARNAVVIEPVEAHSLGLRVFEEANGLLDRPEVSRCHPELVRRKATRNVFPNQWHLGDRKMGGQIISAHASVQNAWAFNKGEGATIAIIDDGVDVDHPEFRKAGKITSPWDAVSNSSDARPRRNQDSHGTACAGVASASGIDGASGVAPDSFLMPIRLSVALGDLLEADAIYWAAKRGADVISCSWGPECGAWDDPTDPRHSKIVPIPDSTALAIEEAARSGRMGKGCSIVWAAGNGNESVDNDGYACHDDVMAVAACSDRSLRSVYSDYGSKIWCAFPSNCFDPATLTTGIWTTDRRGSKGYNDGNPSLGDRKGDYTNGFGGTSSAAPGVAGVAALMITENPFLTAADIRQILAETADKIDKAGGAYDTTGRSPSYGYGRINAFNAVEEASRRI